MALELIKDEVERDDQEDFKLIESLYAENEKLRQLL